MGLLNTFLDWMTTRRERGRQLRAAAQCDDGRTCAEALGFLCRHPGAQEVEVASPIGQALFTRKDVPRLQLVTKGVGERVFARAMMGGSAYGFPGGWSQDRIEQVTHLKSWVYIATRSIWQRIARLVPNVAFVTQHVNGTRSKAVGPWYARKAMGAVKPHEHLTPAGDNHPLVRLFGNPNGPDVSFDFWFELGLFLELTGNSYIWCVPSALGRLDRTYKACEMWVMPSHWVWPRVGKKQLIEYYEIRPFIGPGIIRMPPEDIIHLRFKSPIHKIDGYSPQTAGAEWIDTGESVNRSRFFQFKNGHFPLGSIQMGDRYVDMTTEELDLIAAKFMARYQGESNYGRPVIMPPDTEYKPLTINPTEMAYTQSADQLRDWILALWSVPKEVAGIQDAGSEIAMYGPLRQFSENCLIPRLTYIGQVLTEKLAHRWDSRLRVWWDDPTPDDPEQKRADTKLLYDCQAITTNEIRGDYGKPPFRHGGDDPMGGPGTSPIPLNTGEDLGLGAGMDLSQLGPFGGQGQQQPPAPPPPQRRTMNSANGHANGVANGKR